MLNILVEEITNRYKIVKEEMTGTKINNNK